MVQAIQSAPATQFYSKQTTGTNQKIEMAAPFNILEEDTAPEMDLHK